MLLNSPTNTGTYTRTARSTYRIHLKLIMLMFWRTLLLIALCVQMPLSAMASYATHEPHDHHQHSLSAETDPHAAHAVDHNDDDTLADCCATHVHCAAFHLSMMVQMHSMLPLDLHREAFDLLSEVFSPSELLPSIERPKWVSV